MPLDPQAEALLKKLADSGAQPFERHCQVNWLPRVQATPLSIQTWLY